MPTATWDRLAEQRRTAVIEAAQNEFAEKGFSHASLNTIAREAGVAKGSLFQYFRDKVDLCAYLSELNSDRIRVVIERRAAELDWERDFTAALMTVIAAWVQYFYDNPRDLALTAAANLEPDPTSRAAVREVVNRHYLQIVSPMLELARLRGRLASATDVDALTATLIVLLPHLALAPHISGLDPVLGLDGATAPDAIARAQRVIATVIGPYLLPE
jgi:AcrR family transcriptional regulator